MDAGPSHLTFQMSDSSPIRLSVIVPAYNYGDRLQQSLTSVLAQMSPAVELIVVDDGSTDNTALVIQELQRTWGAAFSYFRQANSGAASARNQGLRLSRGSHVLFLDADDELMPGSIQAVCLYLARHPETDLLLGGHLSCYMDGREKVYRPVLPQTKVEKRVADYLVHKRISLGHGSFVARKSLFAQRPYPEHLRQREDIPVFAHLIAQAHIGCIDHLMVRVNKHSGSLRHKNFGMTEGCGDFIDEVFRTLPSVCQPMRSSYAANRCLSLLRNALEAGEKDAARRYFREALHLDWRQAVRVRNLRKALRAWLSGR
jgi:glycosyltransferase involved in cell wall biosynthesis